MNAQTSTPAQPGTAAAPRFDRKFIEDHQLIERYLNGKLPFKGQRDLENWCRANPEYLNELNLADRAQASLKLLEASGQPQDLGEPPPAWWKTPYFLVALGGVALASLVGFWALYGKLALLRGSLEDARTQLRQGTIAPPVAQRDLRVIPDRNAGAGGPKISVSRGTPELIDLRLDMSRSAETMFRITIDKRDQARALVIGALTKDSNGDLRIAFNSSGLSAGLYDLRIESLPRGGAPVGEGSLVIDAQ